MGVQTLRAEATGRLSIESARPTEVKRDAMRRPNDRGDSGQTPKLRTVVDPDSVSSQARARSGVRR